MTRENLYDLYWVQKLSYADIATKFSRSTTWAQSQFKKFGMKSRTVKEAVKLRHVPVIGKVFGHFTVLEVTGELRKSAICKCRCTCGKIVEVPLAYLLCKTRKSCGCLWKKRYQEMSGEYLWQLKSQAGARGFEFNISPETIWSLFVNQERRCALSGVSISFGKNRTASLDRINSKEGYTENNVQWVHKDVNRMKWDLDQDYFLDLVDKISQKRISDLSAKMLIYSNTCPTLDVVGPWVTDPPQPAGAPPVVTSTTPTPKG